MIINNNNKKTNFYYYQSLKGSKLNQHLINQLHEDHDSFGVEFPHKDFIYTLMDMTDSKWKTKTYFKWGDKKDENTLEHLRYDLQKNSMKSCALFFWDRKLRDLLEIYYLEGYKSKYALIPIKLDITNINQAREQTLRMTDNEVMEIGELKKAIDNNDNVFNSNGDILPKDTLLHNFIVNHKNDYYNIDTIGYQEFVVIKFNPVIPNFIDNIFIGSNGTSMIIDKPDKGNKYLRCFNQLVDNDYLGGFGGSIIKINPSNKNGFETIRTTIIEGFEGKDKDLLSFNVNNVISNNHKSYDKESSTNDDVKNIHSGLYRGMGYVTQTQNQFKVFDKYDVDELQVFKPFKDVSVKELTTKNS